MRVLFAIVLCCLNFLVSRAEVYQSSRTLTGDNGLPHYQVNTIAKDSKGYVWIGTRNGLSRYDGYSIKNYFHSNSDENSLRYNYVRKVFVDSQGRIWVLTVNGLSRFDSDKERFINYPQISTDISSIIEMPDGRIICAGPQFFVYRPESDNFGMVRFPTDFIISMVCDPDGYIYISTNQGVYRVDSALEKFHRLPEELYKDVLTGAGAVMPMLMDSSGHLWIGRNGHGVARYDIESGSIDIIESGPLNSYTVRSLVENRHSHILAGTSSGVVDVTPDDNGNVLPVLVGLKGSSVYALMEDGNNLWAGTYYGGVTIFSSNSRPFDYYVPGDKLSGKVVRMMTETMPGTVWIATEDGGISILDEATGEIRPFSGIPSMGSNVHSLCYDSDKRIMWIGTFMDGLYAYNIETGEYRHYLLSSGLDSDSVFYLAKTENGTLYVATTRGLRIYDPASDTFKALGDSRLDWCFVYTILPVSDSSLWIGTTTEGLFHIDVSSGEIKVWNQHTRPVPLADKFVTTLAMDTTGRVWLGTNNAGMQILEVDGSLISTGRDHSTICAITPDEDGNMWVTSSTGLFKYSPAGLELASFTTENGLPTNQMNLSSAYRSSSGRIYAGSINGLIAFDPNTTDNVEALPEVHIESIFANGKEIVPNDSTGLLTANIDNLSSVRLPQSICRSLTVSYGAILPGTPVNVHYQVMLEGADSYWRSVGQERKVSFFNLSPGSYTLHIRANTSSSDWDEMPVKTLRIIVTPPFYLSWWAITGYILIVILVIVLLFRRLRPLRRGYETSTSPISETPSSEAVEVAPQMNHIEREFMERVDAIVNANLGNSDFCVDDITRALGLSRTLLHTRIKSLTEKSISEYIREKRFSEAKRLLLDGYNVSETAFRCGFGDPNHFSKMFKSRFGVLPSRYADHCSGQAKKQE